MAPSRSKNGKKNLVREVSLQEMMDEALRLLNIKPEESERLARQALTAIPKDPKASSLLGCALIRLSRYKEALPLLRFAIESGVTDSETWFAMGASMHILGYAEQAAESYRQALAAGLHADACNNLAVCLQTNGQKAQAELFLRKALELKPDCFETLMNLGKLMHDTNRDKLALNFFYRAAAMAPNREKELLMRTSLASTLQCLSEYETAAKHWQSLVGCTGEEAMVFYNYGVCEFELGHNDRSKELMNQACDSPVNGGAFYARAFQVDPFPQSMEAIAEERNLAERRVAELLANPPYISDPAKVFARTTFYLAYYGLNDRDIMRDAATALRRSAPPLSYTAPHCQKPIRKRPRIVFVSCVLCNHTIGLLNQGFIDKIDREKFEVFVATSKNESVDTISSLIRNRADRYIDLPPGLYEAQKLLAGLEADIIHFTDLGMHPLTYLLSFSRLAPIQTQAWGHPVSCGVDTVDAFISSKLVEPEDAQSHYSEKLLLLDHMPVCYKRPEKLELRTRAFYGLPESGNLYMCPQSLFKFHPDFDHAMGEILRRDPTGHIIMVESTIPNWMALLRARWQKAFPDVVDRIIFVKRQRREDFIRLMALGDAMIDTFHFGGGNTIYEALLYDVPVVTWPSPYMRGRPAHGIYQSMGLGDECAKDYEDYIQKVVRFGTDKDYAHEKRSILRERTSVIYDNVASVRDLEDKFMELCSQALPGGGLPGAELLRKGGKNS